MIDRKVVHLLVGAMCAGAVLFLSQSVIITTIRKYQRK